MDAEYRNAQEQVKQEIQEERDRQDAKWGEQNHNNDLWLAVLMEEVGEFSQAYLKWRFGKGKFKDMYEEAVQMTAVAQAICECMKRGCSDEIIEKAAHEIIEGLPHEQE